MKTLHSLTSRKPMIRVVFEKDRSTEMRENALTKATILQQTHTLLSKIGREVALAMSLSIGATGIALAQESAKENPSSSSGTVDITLVAKTPEDGAKLKEALAPGIDGATITTVDMSKLPQLPKELEEMGKQTITVSRDGASETKSFSEINSMSESDREKIINNMTDDEYGKYDLFEQSYISYLSKHQKQKTQELANVAKRIGEKAVIATEANQKEDQIDKTIAEANQRIGEKAVIATEANQRIGEKETLLIKGYQEYILRLKLGDKNLTLGILDEIINSNFVPVELQNEAIKLKQTLHLKTASL